MRSFIWNWITVALFILFGSLPLLSHASDHFSASELEKAISDYMNYSEEDLKTQNVSEMDIATAISDLVAILKPTSFNDVVGHLMADYRQHPENRERIEVLSKSLHDSIEAELREIQSSSPVLTVVDDVFRVWTVAYFFGFGKGLWKSRGSGLKGLERFKYVVKSVSNNLPKGKRANLLVLGIGTTAGVIHAVYDALDTHKLDPAHLLDVTQGAAVEDLATNVFNDLSRFKNISRSQASTHSDEIRQGKKTAEQYRAELEHLAQAAPQHRGRMKPILDDLRALENKLAQLGLALDANDLQLP